MSEFEKFMRYEGRSPYTIRQYKYAVRKFLEWLGSKEITEESLFDYVIYLREEKTYHPRSISSTIAAIKKYLGIADVKINWSRVPTPKMSFEFNPVVLSKEQIDTILKNTRKEKHYLALKLAYEACLRVGELCNIKVKDLDFKRGVLRVAALKGGRTTEIPLSPEFAKRLYLYAKRNRKRVKDYLFSTRGGKKINPNYFSSRVFRKLVKKLGIDCRFHDFSRHSRLTHLIRDRVPFNLVHKISRHRRVDVTMDYITLSGVDLEKLISDLP